jgi:dTDP-glucose 4,6-dehydratase
MARVLITGAAGFLGSHLCDRFIKEGFDVVGMDNLITGDLKNIEHLFPLPQFEFYNHDVSKYIHVPGKLDYILHIILKFKIITTYDQEGAIYKLVP